MARFFQKPLICTIICFLLGSISALSMAPLNAWPFLFLGLSGLYYILAHTERPFLAFINGYVFALGYFLFSLSWIGNALLVEDNPYVWAWPLAVAGLPLLLSFFTGFAVWIACKLIDLKTISGYLAFAAILTLAAWLRGHIFTGFPWNLYGYTWADILPLIQITALSNIYFLTFLTILWGTLPGFVFTAPTKKQKITAGLISLISLTLCLGFGFWRLGTYAPTYNENIEIKIVQPNILQNEKWDRTKMPLHFERLIDLSKNKTNSEKTTYIIWPETALHYAYLEDPAYNRAIQNMLRSYQTPSYIITGLLRRDLESGNYANAMVMIDQNGQVSNIYDKSHLVPFGEYIPFQNLIPLKPVVQFTGFKKGSGPQTLTTPENISYSPLICYEAIFPGKSTSKQGPIPDFLLNVTNDAWYGDSAGPHQHFTNTKFRAVETGIPLIRSANTGISGFVSPLGHIIYSSNISHEYEKTLALPNKKSDIMYPDDFRTGGLLVILLTFIGLGGLKKKKN